MEDYVSFEQAVDLKILGFDWKCNHWYHQLEPDKILESDDYSNHNRFERPFSAPTLAQAARWLREVKGISVEPFSSVVGKDWAYQLYHTQKDKFGLSVVVDKKCVKEYGYATYEEALAEGVSQALKLLK